MRCNEELVERLARRHNEKIGPLSSQAYDELVLAVRKDPEAFLADDADRAFQRLGQALAANAQSRADEEFLDDDSYEAARARRMERLEAGCREALDLDGGCLDAKTVIALASNKDADQALIALDALWDGTRGDEQLAQLGGVADASAWDDVFARPLLRLLAARARAQLDTARYQLASASCARLVELDPTDELGARFTWAVALARLEDEQGFDQLDARFDRKGNAWSHLARTLLMFKLDRMGAARRALRGYASLCTGGAYALLRPAFVDTYLPDRPEFAPGSFEEASLAVHECDPVVMDTPDFLTWAGDQDGFTGQAQRFAQDNDLDW